MKQTASLGATGFPCLHARLRQMETSSKCLKRKAIMGNTDLGSWNLGTLALHTEDVKGAFTAALRPAQKKKQLLTKLHLAPFHPLQLKLHLFMDLMERKSNFSNSSDDPSK